MCAGFLARMSDIAPHAEAIGLAYVTSDGPGITRRRSGPGFSYRDADGALVRDKETLARIKSLAIPPAWEDVWICPDAHGHLQAAGRDARGRKQHRYHPRFREVRDAAKFERLTEFAKALPALRKRIDEDMGLRGLPREKVLATIAHLLDTTLIRVGTMIQAVAFAGFALSPSIGRSALIVSGNLLALGNGMTQPSVSAYVSKRADPTAQGGTLGTNQSFASLARMIGPAFGGWLYGAFGPRSPYIAGALGMAVAGIVALSLRTTRSFEADQRNTSTQTS